MMFNYTCTPQASHTACSRVFIYAITCQMWYALGSEVDQPCCPNSVACEYTQILTYQPIGDKLVDRCEGQSSDSTTRFFRSHYLKEWSEEHSRLQLIQTYSENTLQNDWVLLVSGNYDGGCSARAMIV